jgi:murein L,D-transpeptidase YcbB/YkuD
LAEAELNLTQTVLTYARHLQAGRFFRHQIKYEIGLPQAAPDPEEVLAKMAEAADPGAALDEFAPQNEPYRRLKTMLAKMRSNPATGNLDAQTVRKLNGGGPDRAIDTIIANMERWRWYPRDLGEAHVLVNLPDFSLKMMHKGAQIWSSRIVIGEPSKPTPLLSEKMTSITLNPVWHVPPSIVQHEYLPALARDRHVLARMGLHLSYKDGEPQITMPAGGINPLGHIRFNFYNRFTVFQHDTPDQYMFGHAVRAESHGCMRVEHAAKYAELLFNLGRPNEHWTAEKVKSTYGSPEQELELSPGAVWLHLTYQTAFVDDDGKLQIRRDLYNLDRRTLAALKNDPVVAGPAPAAKRDRETSPASRHRRTAHRSQSADPLQSPFSAEPSHARPRPAGRAFSW